MYVRNNNLRFNWILESFFPRFELNRYFSISRGEEKIEKCGKMENYFYCFNFLFKKNV